MENNGERTGYSLNQIKELKRIASLIISKVNPDEFGNEVRRCKSGDALLFSYGEKFNILKNIFLDDEGDETIAHLIEFGFTNLEIRDFVQDRKIVPKLVELKRLREGDLKDLFRIFQESKSENEQINKSIVNRVKEIYFKVVEIVDIILNYYEGLEDDEKRPEAAD